jgi:hypothetical protein
MNDVSAISLSLCALIACSSCVSTNVPPPLSSQQRSIVNSQTLPQITLGLESPEGRYQDALDQHALQIYTQNMIMRLRQTELFDEVNITNLLSRPPDLIARLDLGADWREYGEIFPIFTVLTLGIVPQWIKTDDGIDFSLYAPDSANQIEIKNRQKGTVCMGWACTFLNILPSWYAMDIDHNTIQYLRWSVLAHRDDILLELERGGKRMNGSNNQIQATGVPPAPDL